MATTIPSFPFVEKITSYVPSPQVDTAVHLAGKFMRFKILADRRRPQFSNVDRDGGMGAYEHEPTNKTGTWMTKPHIKQLYENGYDNANPSLYEGYTHEPTKFLNPSDLRRMENKDAYDKISIIDLDYDNAPEESRKKYSKLVLPFVPSELNYSMESRFVGIATMGRNNPYYQFTGSEDKLEFEIDWFSEQANREDVIYNCRWLESLTKGDGYLRPPSRVMLSWGANNLLWRNFTWLVVKAPYVLGSFVRGYRDMNTKEIINTNMLPQQAKQQITLVRLTNSNLTTVEIEGSIKK